MKCQYMNTCIEFSQPDARVFLVAIIPAGFEIWSIRSFGSSCETVIGDSGLVVFGGALR